VARGPVTESSLETYRDALSGIELPTLDVPAVEEAVALSAARILELKAAMKAALGANGEEAQLFRMLETIAAAGETYDAVSLAARELQSMLDAAREAERSCRMVLAQAMAEAGAPAISSGRYRADPLDGSQRVQIEEAALLPPAYWRTPEPEPDRAKIRAALLDGRAVPGARLVTGPPSVRITAKESKE
jgi:hypothetical protein